MKIKLIIISIGIVWLNLSSIAKTINIEWKAIPGIKRYKIRIIKNKTNTTYTNVNKNQFICDLSYGSYEISVAGITKNGIVGFYSKPYKLTINKKQKNKPIPKLNINNKHKKLKGYHIAKHHILIKNKITHGTIKVNGKDINANTLQIEKEGRHEFIYSIIDTLGNSRDLVFRAIIDKTPPTIKAHICNARKTGSMYYTTTNTYIYFTVKDNIDTNPKLYISYKSNFTRILPYQRINIPPFTNELFIYYTAIDRYGNKSKIKTIHLRHYPKLIPTIKISFNKNYILNGNTYILPSNTIIYIDTSWNTDSIYYRLDNNIYLLYNNNGIPITEKGRHKLSIKLISIEGMVWKRNYNLLIMQD